MPEPLLDALESMPTPGLIFSTDSRLRWANEAGLRLLQTYLDAIVDMSAETLFQRFLSIHVSTEGLTPERPVRATLPDGKKAHLEITRRDLDGPKDWAFILYLSDIGPRYRAETLKAEANKYLQILEELPVEVVVLDSDDRFEYLNPTAIQDGELRRWLIGRTEKDLHARRRLSPHIAEQRIEQVCRVRETGRPTQFEDEMVDADGRPHHVLRLLFPLWDDNGNIRRILGCGIEITERVLAEKKSRRRAQESRESQLRYRRLFEQSRDAVSVSDPEGRLVDVNRAALDLLGYGDKEELLNLDIGQTVWIDAQARKEVFQQARTRGYTEFETRFRTRSGEIRRASGTMAEMKDDEGKTEGYLAIVRDVTEQRQVEEELRQAQKMEAIGRLAGGIAHDFNNLLTAINGYCDILLDEAPSGEMRAYVEEIEAAGRRASSLTAKLLTLSRKEKSAPSTVGLDDLIRDLEGLLRRLIGEDVKLEVQLGDGPFFVEIDPGQIDQAILNLATNARDAMPRGGRLSLTLRHIAAPEKDVEQTGTSADGIETPENRGPRVELEVADTGDGIDPEVLAHIYEPFFTTKAAGQGTGLGLSTTYATVHRFGGTIDVDSKRGIGTRFRLSFPAVQAPPDDESGSYDSTPSRPGHETILLAEDDDIVRQLVTAQLHRQGYAVLAADTGDAALDIVAEEPHLDLLISDVVMPGISGPELASRVRRRFQDLPILFISGYTGTFLEQHGFEKEHYEVLAKPFTAKALVARVRDLLDGVSPDP